MADISFDANYYYEQKLNQLQSTDSEQYGDWTIADVALSFNENGLTAAEHYEKYGVAEGLNPSAEFDTQAYLSAKLGQLQEQDSEQYADWTVEDVAQAFADNGLSPLEHFNQFGQDEGLEATPAAASELTEALETLQTAESNLTDYLEGLELDTNYDGEIDQEAGEVEESEVTAARDAVDTALGNHVNDLVNHTEVDTTAIGNTDYATGDSLNVLEAKLQDAKDALAEKNEAAAETDGLPKAIDNLQAAEEANVAAVEALGEAETALQAEIAKFEIANSVTISETLNYTTLPAEYDADTPANNILVTDGGSPAQNLIEVNESDELVISSGADELDGIDALLTAVQSSSDAIAAANSAEQSLSSALEAIVELTVDVDAELAELAGANADQIDSYDIAVDGLIKSGTGADSGDGSLDLSATSIAITAKDSDGNVVQDDAGTPADVVYDSSVADFDGKIDSAVTDVLSAETDVATFEAVIAEREELIADLEEAQGRVDQVDELKQAITEAEAAIEDPEEDGGLGVNLLEQTDALTSGDDLVLFADNKGNTDTIANFGASGEDKIFFGDDFELVALGEGESIEDRVGASDQLEVFWEQNGNDLNLYVEADVEAGRETVTDNVTTIELTGVSADDVSFENGFLSAGTAVA